ncbi:MAG TPA: MAPEG family protein [Woeseiaceae bacterium]|nr:MAPEG family protein [Woeseiaceae bacterium]
MAESQAILAPFLAMMLLTALVWAYMYIRRLAYIKANGVRPQDLATPEKAAAVLPEAVALPANNLRNLLELPVLFYALCLYLEVTGSADGLHVASAWAFAALRTVHSVIHCTANVVVFRFLSYFAAALVLWFMLARVLLNAAGF